MGKAGFAEDYLLVLSCWTLFQKFWSISMSAGCIDKIIIIVSGEVSDEKKKYKLRG